MVYGFTGDSSDWWTFNICLFMISNYLMFQVLVEFLCQRLDWFADMRQNWYRRWQSHIWVCTCFDILVTVMPAVWITADYKNGLKF